VELAGPQSTRWVADAPRNVGVFGHGIRVEVRLEEERLNVNTADRTELVRWFERAAPADARAIVARLEDWKDADARPLATGAEVVEHRSGGLAYTPRGGPFESPEEVRQTLGLDSVGSGWTDDVTVYGSSHVSVPSPHRQFTTGDIARVKACAPVAEGTVCRTAVARLTGHRRDALQIFSWR
jgi:hypothetical protein